MTNSSFIPYHHSTCKRTVPKLIRKPYNLTLVETEGGMSVYISLALSNSWEMPLLCVEQLCTNNAENGTFQLRLYWLCLGPPGNNGF